MRGVALVSILTIGLCMPALAQLPLPQAPPVTVMPPAPPPAPVPSVVTPSPPLPGVSLPSTPPPTSSGSYVTPSYRSNATEQPPPSAETTRYVRKRCHRRRGHRCRWY